MIRTYAIFSNKWKNLHKILIFSFVVVTMFSFYQLLENEDLVYLLASPALLVVLCLWHKSSNYKRRYLTPQR